MGDGVQQTLTQRCGRELDATERHQPPTGSSVSDPSLFEVVSFRMHINYAMEDHGLHAMSRRPAYEASYGVLTLAVSRVMFALPRPPSDAFRCRPLASLLLCPIWLHNRAARGVGHHSVGGSVPCRIGFRSFLMFGAVHFLTLQPTL